MEMTLYYRAWSVDGEGEWNVPLTADEEKAYARIAVTGADPQDVPEFAHLCARAYPDIERALTDMLREAGDEYCLECLGEVPADPDELLDLVRARDPHALAFFGLEGADEDEIDEWDPDELYEYPLVRDFYEDFEPASPFEEGRNLCVRLPGKYELPENADVTDGDIEQFLASAMEAGDVGLAEEIVRGREEDYGGDIRAQAVRAAVGQGCVEYLRHHAQDADPDDSFLLEETQDDRVRSLLVAGGVRIDMSAYEGCRYAADAEENRVIAFSEELQDELYAGLLRALDAGEEELADMLEDPQAPLPDPDRVPGSCGLRAACDALHIRAEDGSIVLEGYGAGEEADVPLLNDILASLGFAPSFIGCRWRSMVRGVYYVE